MGKETMIRVRVDESDANTLRMLEKKYGLTKSQIIRDGINNFEAISEKRYYPLNINDITKYLGDEYNGEACGIVDNNIALGKGLWIDLSTDFSISEDKYMKYGMCSVSMKNNKIHIEGGYLEDIKNVLSRIYSDRRRGGVGMSYFKISNDDDKIESHILKSYDITKQIDCVILSLDSFDYKVEYELRPDSCIKTIEDICNILNKLLDKVTAEGYQLIINEYFVRSYVSIGYETDEDFRCERFTASKL